LAKHVIPQLFDGKDASDSIRVWVPGCATGEEAYTIAILLLEEAARREIRPQVQVFGSDLDVGGLAVAREGRYPIAIEADVSEERLRRFFSREGDHYRARRELRDVIGRRSCCSSRARLSSNGRRNRYSFRARRG
jgi:two-component system CheB/CheR fusion protein